MENPIREELIDQFAKVSVQIKEVESSLYTTVSNQTIVDYKLLIQKEVLIRLALHEPYQESARQIAESILDLPVPT